MVKPQPAEKNIVEEATFRFEITGYSALRDKRKGVISPPHIIGGLPWRIVALPDVYYLGLFIQCDGELENPFWSCKAIAELRIVPQSGPARLESEKIEQNFYHGQAWAGYAKFCRWVDNFKKDDAIIVEAWISAGKPRKLSIDHCTSFKLETIM